MSQIISPIYLGTRANFSKATRTQINQRTLLLITEEAYVTRRPEGVE